jgi:hypothetical protein
VTGAQAFINGFTIGCVAFTFYSMARLRRAHRREVGVLKGMLVMTAEAMMAAQHDKLPMRAEEGVCRMVSAVCSIGTPPMFPDAKEPAT